MILADTSIWIDYLRGRSTALSRLLDQHQILSHPVVLGELMLGGLRSSDPTLVMIQDLPAASVADHTEVLMLIARESITGIGYADAHLLASAQLTSEGRLWTRDQSLLATARRLSVAFEPSVH